MRRFTGLKPVFRREFKAYFSSPLGYVYIVDLPGGERFSDAVEGLRPLAGAPSGRSDAVLQLPAMALRGPGAGGGDASVG